MKYLDLAIANEYLKLYDITPDGKCINKATGKIKKWDSIADVEKELKINHANIITVCNQNTNRKYAGGYIWRYE